MNLRLFAFLICLASAEFLFAQSSVDSLAQLETISTDFELADGPAWDGVWSLYIPDVKAGKLLRYIPKTKQLHTVLPDAGRISASFFNQGTLYLSDNGASSIAKLVGNKKVTIAQQDPDAKPPIRPNDLVVDARGGIYYTLTRQNQVAYVSPTGKQAVAIQDVETPNGITLSPDGKTLYIASYVPRRYGLSTSSRMARQPAAKYSRKWTRDRRKGLTA